MQMTFDLKLPFEDEPHQLRWKELAAQKLKVKEADITAVKLIKRSLDARKKNIQVQLRFAVYLNEEFKPPAPTFDLKPVNKAEEIHLVGFGPAGMFSALSLIHHGYKPIIYERGKDVRARRRDLAKLNKEQLVNPESNYCFGEGGAGTYSDGKLYTRSKKRGDVQAILRTLIDFGADPQIEVEAHPHIGTNKLPKIIVAMREAIIQAGGEVHFEHKLTDLEIEGDQIKAIELNHATKVPINQLILATGHSARDIFELLYKKGMAIKAKPFALGVRVEHPQDLINQIQYHSSNYNEALPPAAYKLVEQVKDKGVYSFCMCPGGIIAPCATNKAEIVTNGWSPSRRNNPFANSGMVVSVEEKDWEKYADAGPLAALRLQEAIEQKAYSSVNSDQNGQLAPAQRLTDFVHGKLSKTLPKCSYQPGISSARVDLILPAFISKRLQKAFLAFGEKMKGYLSPEAIVVGVESRTSSPVQIPREGKLMNHTELKNLYPTGEGAGYAGGIVSAGIDGVKAAEAIVNKLKLEKQQAQVQ